MKYINLISLFVLLTCCDPIDRLVIKNASQENIFYTIAAHSDLKYEYDEKLPDLTFRNYVHKLGKGHTEERTRLGANAWEYFIEKECDNQKLHIYLFDIDVLKKHSWKEVTEKGLYKEKRIFSLEEIKEAKWQIVLQ